MYVHDKVNEPDLLQPCSDGFDGGSLLGDEQHTFDCSDERRDKICDGMNLESRFQQRDAEDLLRSETA